jgi:thiol-disulfide isomerase/thioredoxin
VTRRETSVYKSFRRLKIRQFGVAYSKKTHGVSLTWPRHNGCSVFLLDRLKMKTGIKIVFSLLYLFSGISSHAEDIDGPINKLQYMYQFYYLPFSLEFREGKTVNDILPFVSNSRGEPLQLIKAAELETLDKEWNDIKSGWPKKSLLLSNSVSLNKTVRITSHLISHKISLSRKAMDTLPINERIQLGHLLSTKSPEVQASFKQLRFIKSFMQPIDELRFNFFLVSASWCDSCREYKVLLETYMKTFPDQNLTFHSVVIEDPKEEIFDSQILKDLFPHPKKYTHDSIPRFLAYDQSSGRPVIYEEGEALKEVYDRFFKNHRGYMNARVKLFKTPQGKELSQYQTTFSSLTR